MMDSTFASGLWASTSQAMVLANVGSAMSAARSGGGGGGGFLASVGESSGRHGYGVPYASPATRPSRLTRADPDTEGGGDVRLPVPWWRAGWDGDMRANP